MATRMGLSHAEIAGHFQCSRQFVTKLVKKGMPTTSLEAATKWRDANSPNQKTRSNQLRNLVRPVALLSDPEPIAGESIEDSIERLRALEKSYAEALQKAVKERWTLDTRQLQRDHVQAFKALNYAEEKLLLRRQRRGELMTAAQAEKMICAALSPISETLRNLPATYQKSKHDHNLVCAVVNKIFEVVRDGVAKYVIHEGIDEEDITAIEKQEAEYRTAFINERMEEIKEEERKLKAQYAMVQLREHALALEWFKMHNEPEPTDGVYTIVGHDRPVRLADTNNKTPEAVHQEFEAEYKNGVEDHRKQQP